jgi:IPT/TIG domain
MGDGEGCEHLRVGPVEPRGSRRSFRRALAAVALLTLLMVGLGASTALASGAPAVETERASEVTRSVAVLNASVDPNSLSTSCDFEYGTTEGALEKTVPCDFSPGSRPIDVAEYAALSGLAEGTTYFFRVHATNEDGEVSGAEFEFSTLPSRPRPNTEDAKEVHRTSAVLTGFVTPNGSSVIECSFGYGKTPGPPYEGSVPCEQTVGAGGEPSEPVFVTAHVSTLAEKTKYYFRLFATNGIGSKKGGQLSFSTLPSAPNANTEGTRHVERTSATLRGVVTPNDGFLESCYFVYRQAGELAEHTIACETLPGGSGEAPEAVSANLTGLAESTTYVVHLVATNSFGTGEGGSSRFTTQPTGPKVLLHLARNITSTSAELTGEVNPEDSEVTECYFEYGTTPALGGVQPCATLPGNGERNVKVTAAISGLTADTLYYQRVVAVNEFGRARGGERERKNFTTASGGKPPVVTKVKPTKGDARGGTKVTIVGQNFEGTTTVFFGDTEATIVHETVSKIEAVSPPGVGTVDITVRTESGTSRITSDDEFTYGKPEIETLSPNSGPESGGTEVIVSGFGFELGAYGTTFAFAGETGTSVECPSSTTCYVISPAYSKAKSVKVEATVNGKTSRNQKYTYTAG